MFSYIQVSNHVFCVANIYADPVDSPRWLPSDMLPAILFFKSIPVQIATLHTGLPVPMEIFMKRFYFGSQEGLLNIGEWRQVTESTKYEVFKGWSISAMVPVPDLTH